MRPFSVLCLMLLALGNTFAHVILDSPVGGENYDPDQIVKIRWTINVPHTQNNWDLYFSSDGGSTWQNLALDLPVAQLYYDWTVPEIETSQAKIKIVMDNEGTNYEDDSGNFLIGIFIPLILNYPIGDETFSQGASEQIAWEVNGLVTFDTWSVFFSDNGGDTWTVLVEDLMPATLMYSWTVPQINTIQGRIKLEMNIGTTVYEDLSGVFTINEDVVTALNELDRQGKNLSVYPNPFTGKASFQIDLDKPTPVVFAIYNQTGRLVYTEDHNKFSPGLHNINWQPTDLQAGLYFYSVITNDHSSTGKLLYNK